MNRRELLAYLSIFGGSVIAKKTFANFTPPPNDPNLSDQWHLATLNVQTAWLLSQGDSGTKIAIIGTGTTLATDYPVNAVTGYNFIDGNTNTADQYTGSNRGHDSVTAALAMAATNNANQGVGICPNATLMPLISCGSNGVCNFGLTRDALTFATQNGADIISMSFNLPLGAIQTELITAHTAGIILTGASSDLGGINVTIAPAGQPYVTGVGAVDNTDTIASFSTGGCVKVVAPGVNVYASVKDGSFSGGNNGCSYACPLVAGVQGLMLTANSRYSKLRNDEVNLLLWKYGCDAIQGIAGYPTIDTYYGYGRVNAAKAVVAAAGYVRPFSVKTIPIGN